MAQTLEEGRSEARGGEAKGRWTLEGTRGPLQQLLCDLRWDTSSVRICSAVLASGRRSFCSWLRCVQFRAMHELWRQQAPNENVVCLPGAGAWRCHVRSLLRGSRIRFVPSQCRWRRKRQGSEQSAVAATVSGTPSLGRTAFVVCFGLSQALGVLEKDA